MRYVAALAYAVAIAGHTADLVNPVGLGACIFVGTVALFFAIEAIGRTLLYEAWRRHMKALYSLGDAQIPETMERNHR